MSRNRPHALTELTMRRPRPPAYRNERSWIVALRSGPTPIAEIGAPDISSSAFT